MIARSGAQTRLLSPPQGGGEEGPGPAGKSGRTKPTPNLTGQLFKEAREKMKPIRYTEEMVKEFLDDGFWTKEIFF